MEEKNSMKTFKYSSSHQPMFNVIETPLQYRSFSQNNAVFQDLSFSSYLKPKDINQNSPKDGDTVEDAEISIFDARKYFSEINDPKEIKKEQQQHQEPSHDLLSVPRISSVSSVDGYGRNFRTRSFHATPTASSEASWNSQTGLLANPPGSTGVSLRNFSPDQGKKRDSAAKRWIFGRKCCCTGKKSVRVKEVVTSESEHRGPEVVGNKENNNNNNNKSNNLYAKREQSQKEKAPPPPNVISQPNSIKNDIVENHEAKVSAQNPLMLSPDNEYAPPDSPRLHQRVSARGKPFIDGTVGFSFPILNSSNPKGLLNNKKIIMNPMEDPPRDSLEIFQPIHEPISRPPGLTDGSVRLRFSPGSPIGRVTNTCVEDDAGSDASSDLFEIESFSTQTTSYPMYRRRDSLDEAPAFNAGRLIRIVNGVQYGRRSMEDEPPTPSVAGTECYPPSEVSIDWSVTTAEGFERASISASEMGSAAFFRPPSLQVEEDGGKMRKGGNGGLLMMSCRQEKAVSVGPQPVKCVAAEGPPVRPPRAGKPPIGSSHSARLSLAFAA